MSELCMGKFPSIHYRYFEPAVDIAIRSSAVCSVDVGAEFELTNVSEVSNTVIAILLSELRSDAMWLTWSRVND